MKRTKRLKLLCIALVAIIAGTFAVTRIQSYSEKIKTGGGTILDLSASEVNTISWDGSSDTLSFHKSEDEWIYDEDEDFPVNDNSVNGLIADFADFDVSFTIEDADDLSQYGLDDPVCTINISTDDEDYEIKLGSYSNMDEQRYVSIGDGNVYLASSDPYDDFNIDIESLMADDDIPYSFGDEVTVKFEGAYTYGFEYVEDNTYTACSDDMYFTTAKHLALDTDKVTTYLNNISYVGLGSCMTYSATDEDKEKYGLANPDLRVTINYVDSDEEEQTFAFSIGRKVADRDIELDEIDSSIEAYIQIEGSDIIYEITGSDMANILAGTYADLRHDEIFTSDTENVSKFVVEIDGSKYTFNNKGSKKKQKWYLDDEEVEAEQILTTLQDITADEYTRTADCGKEEMSITIYSDNDNTSKIKYEFYRNDGDTCIVKINGKINCTVERSQVVDLIEAVNELIL